MKSLSLLIALTFGFQMINANPVSISSSDFLVFIEMDDLGEVTFYSAGGEDKIIYTRAGEFSFNDQGYSVSGISLNGQAVEEGNTALVTLASGTEVIVDFSTAGEVHFSLY